MNNVKTLANCTDVEFLRQTNKIRHAVEEWLTLTDILNIRSRAAAYETIPEGTDKKQAELIEKKNERLKREQARKNISAALDAMLDDHPEETLKIIRLCCFVEPDDNTRKITFYMDAFTKMMNDKDVLDFFTSLANLGQALGLTL